jgi:hypothetical protein
VDDKQMNELHIVEWKEIFRVINALGAVITVCETREEAEAYIAGQPVSVEPSNLELSVTLKDGDKIMFI